MRSNPVSALLHLTPRLVMRVPFTDGGSNANRSLLSWGRPTHTRLKNDGVETE